MTQPKTDYEIERDAAATAHAVNWTKPRLPEAELAALTHAYQLGANWGALQSPVVKALEISLNKISLITCATQIKSWDNNRSKIKEEIASARKLLDETRKGVGK